MIGDVPIWTGRIGVIRCVIVGNCDVGVGVVIEDEVGVQQIEGSMREVVKCELIVLILVMPVP